MDYSHRGLRVRARYTIDSYVPVPKGTQGTINGEMENLGRRLISISWEGAFGTGCVFPDDVEVIDSANDPYSLT